MAADVAALEQAGVRHVCLTFQTGDLAETLERIERFAQQSMLVARRLGQAKRRPNTTTRGIALGLALLDPTYVTHARGPGLFGSLKRSLLPNGSPTSMTFASQGASSSPGL